MVKLVFFASIREQLGVDSEELVLPEGVSIVADLVEALRTRGEPWLSVLGATHLLVAVNQEMCSLEAAVENGDEVAFFPPVTGG